MTRTSSGNSPAARLSRSSWSIEVRNAASVLPEPVGAAISVCCPERIERQPSLCAVVAGKIRALPGSRKRVSEPRWRTGWKASGSMTDEPKYTPRQLHRAWGPRLRAQIGRARLLDAVERAPHAAPALVQHMGVDHRSRDIRMPEQFLHRADVVAGFNEVRGERVAQRVRAHGLGDPRVAARLLQRARRYRFI